MAAADHDPSVLTVPDTGLPAASLGKLPFRWRGEGFWEPAGGCANPPPPTSVSSWLQLTVAVAKALERSDRMRW